MKFQFHQLYHKSVIHQVTMSFKPQIKSFIQIKNEWDKIQTLDIKSKFKAMRTIGFDISISYKKNTASVEQLEFYIMVIKQVIKIRSYPEPARKCLSRLIADWATLKTCGKKPTTISKIDGEVFTETCSIIMADSAYCSDKLYYNDELRFINQGHGYIFETSMDGAYDVQLRVIDFVEPVLTSRELRYTEDCSEHAIIHIPTGNIVIAGTGDMRTNILLSVTPGNYKICVYEILIADEEIEYEYSLQFIIVLCATDKKANNSFSKMHYFSA